MYKYENKHSPHKEFDYSSSDEDNISNLDTTSDEEEIDAGEIIVRAGQGKTVGPAENISTYGLSDCSAIVLISPLYKKMMHIWGSYLQSPLKYNGLEYEAGEVVTKWCKMKPTDTWRAVIVFGDSNHPPGFDAMLLQNYKNEKPVIKLLRKFQPNNILFYKGFSFKSSGKQGHDFVNAGCSPISLKDRMRLLKIIETGEDVYDSD